MSRYSVAVRSDRLALACSIGVVLAVFALLLVPALALAFTCGGDDAAVCAAPEPPGHAHAFIAPSDLGHGLALCGGPVLFTPTRGFTSLPSGELTPQGLGWTVTLVGRPPPFAA